MSPFDSTYGCEGFIAWSRILSQSIVYQETYVAMHQYLESTPVVKGRRTSINTLGTVTLNFGSSHVPVSAPPEGYAMCDLWSSESAFCPSQQLGKLCRGRYQRPFLGSTVRPSCA